MALPRWSYISPLSQLVQYRPDVPVDADGTVPELRGNEGLAQPSIYCKSIFVECIVYIFESIEDHLYITLTFCLVFPDRLYRAFRQQRFEQVNPPFCLGHISLAFLPPGPSKPHGSCRSAGNVPAEFDKVFPAQCTAGDSVPRSCRSRYRRL